MGAKSNYILESQTESERLDRQSRMAAFDFKLELQFLKVLEGQKILDAGCGSGIVSDYLSTRAEGVRVLGWDFSKSHVATARAKYGSGQNISFAQKNLLELGKDSSVEELAGEPFDTIVCRFVLRHFSDADTQKVIRNLFGALKPGGVLYCIDVEGVLGDIFPSTPFLRKALYRLREAKTVNFHIARKLPSLLLDQGFQNVDRHVLTCDFRGDDLAQEINNLKEEIQNAQAFVKKILGGEDQFERFKKEYFTALRNPGSVLLYNKVVAIGTKPKRGLKSV